MHKHFYSVTLVYFLSGIVWLLLGTLVIGIIDRNTPGTDLSSLYHYKNGIFLLITGGALFFLLKAHSKHLLKVEENYHMLFEGSPGAVYVMNKQTYQFMAVNDVMVKKYGYSREQLLKMTVMDIRNEEEQLRLRDYLTSDHDEGHETGIWLHQKKNGDLFYMLISHHSIKFKDQDAYMVIAIDVDQNIRNEKKLNEIRWENSHEIRKPVCNIKGLIGLISKNKPTDPEIIELLTASVDKLDAVILRINSNNENKTKTL